MNRLSMNVDSGDFLSNKNSTTKKNHSGSLSDLSQSDGKITGISISREDSILSKSSLTSLFSKKSSEGSWSNGSVGTIYAPRPEKTMLLFEKILQTLKEMYDKYYNLTTIDDGIEHQDYNEICTKIDDRLRLIQSFKTNYVSLLENKKVEYDKIQSNLRTVLTNKNFKQTNDLGETDTYWLICRELFLIENKLEKCTGKLQFQIMDLDSISKLNPTDQYELSIKLNETAKFKTKIKIEKNGHQLWDSRNFDINPNIDDSANIKFSELKPLNKSIVLLDIKLPFINDLMKSSTSIFNFWLTPLGTIKLNVIVQWNAQLEDLGLQAQLHNMDNKCGDNSLKTEVVMRGRSYRHGNKLSANIESLFRSSRSENTLLPHLMSNILEANEDEKKLKETNKKSSDKVKSTEIQSIKIEIQSEEKLNENSEQSAKINDSTIEGELATSECTEEKPKAVLMRQKKINILIHEDNPPNEELTSISKEEILEQIIPTNPLNDLKNNDEIIESPIITVSEMAIENVEKEKNEIIIEDNYIVENESLSSVIDTVTNEHSPEKVTNNEIEVEINIDSSEVESIEQLIDDNVKLNSKDNCNNDRSQLESYTIEDNVFGSTDDNELIPLVCNVSNIVPVEDTATSVNKNNCNIDCLSSLDRSKLESDTIEDNTLESTNDSELIQSECHISNVVPVDDTASSNNENDCNIDCLSSLYESKLESDTKEDNGLRNTDDIEKIPS